MVEYLVDAGEQDPDGDVEAQFMDWYQVREEEETVPGETHYKALLQAARVMARSFEEGQPGRGRRHAGRDQLPGELRCGDPGLPAAIEEDEEPGATGVDGLRGWR